MRKFHYAHSRYKDYRAIKRKKPVQRIVRKKATKTGAGWLKKLFK